MRFPLKAFFLVLALALIAGAVLANVLLSRIARSEEFRRFAEQKVGEYLKAKVHIGEIKPYRFDQIALDKIIIETTTPGKGSQLIRVDRLLFRYDLRQLWNRRFDAPAAVALNNPTLLIEQDQFPYRYFENGPNNGSGFSVPTLDFKGGEIRYLLPSIGKEILLREVEGKITSSTDGRVRMDVRAKASGVLEGRVSIHGTIRPFENTHDLWLELGSMKFSQDIPLPFKEMKGKVHWVGRDLFFDDLQALLYGWQTNISGAFLNREGQPEVSSHMKVGKEKPWVKLDFLLNLFQQNLQGDILIAGGQPFHFGGRVHQEGKRFIMDSLKMDRGYHGRGAMDFATGNYDLIFENGKTKRAEVHSNLRGLEFAIAFHLDHFKVFNLDLVTQGKIFLHAVSTRWKDRSFMFKGALETDYFILERQPYDDLRGVFDVSPYGISGIRVGWGEKFRLTGQVIFPGRKPQAKLALHVDDFDLGHVKEFLARPLPKELGGILRGKLGIEGDFMKPEFNGVFNVRDGRWGRLYYDRGIFQLRGIPPYLPLQDSKIWKGRTTLYLKGALDLRLDNIFAGVKIDTPDNLVIWKGLEAVAHSKDGSVEVSRSKPGGWGEFSLLEATADTTDASKETRNDDEERTTVKVGPKLKF